MENIPISQSGWHKVKLQKREILVAITGHGFGHASRVLQIVNRIYERDPMIHFTIVTPVVEWFIRSTCHASFEIIPLQLDVGAVQKDALELDPEATLKKYAEFILHRDIIFKTLEESLKDKTIEAVLYDIPPLGGEIGAWLGVPTFGVTNFSWDWIYQEYIEIYPEYFWILEEMKEQYQRTTVLYELPYSGDLSSFPVRESISWICRRAKTDPKDVRKKLNLDPQKPVALITFGGIGTTVKLPTGVWTKDIHFLVTAPVLQVIGEGEILENDYLHQLEITFPDLIQMASFVVSKPGYGIVSECIAHQTPLLFIERKKFREYHKLLEAMQQHLKHQQLTTEALESGDWQGVLEKLFAKRTLPRDPDPTMEGDLEVADSILNFITLRG
ncbi:MAG: hypothetical protein N2450_01190 [bacterium]|nr:hypothetical protein [bacterium]